MVIAVDIGNSAIKLASESTPDSIVRINKSSTRSEFEQQIAKFAAGFETEQSSHWIVCSVDASQTESLAQCINATRPQDRIYPISDGDIPLESLVDHRKTLGRDRLLAAWFASNESGPDANSIVVDAGTAVTIDLVVEQVHQGGLIFPGAGTCLAALGSQTDALPDLTIQPPPTVTNSLELGTSTRDAILLGVHQHQLFGIAAMVASLQVQYTNLQVFCCGGALTHVADSLPDAWIHRPSFLTDAIFALSRRIP